ncbi:MAG: hypothetical protein ABSF84_13690 [Acidimicrobiales bacterium]|jgi:hypothetical protein
MFRSLFSRRGAVAIAAATIGVASLSLAAAGTAGATTPDASLLIGSGSQTAYAMMTQMGNLFNSSPGCDLTASTSLPLALNCGTSSNTAGFYDGEQGFAVAGENPYNDFSVQAPPVGSGNGATQLEDAGAGSPTTSGYTISYSRASAHKGNTTDNDVEYATDGVSYVTFAEVGGVKTDQDKVTSISLTNLKAIWGGTLTCVVKGVTYNMDWICLGAKKSSPIDVYDAQTGSGTYSTWSGALSYTAGSGLSTPGITCSACEAGWTSADVTADGSADTTHSNLFENQMATISSLPDAANAIYFMSYGKFTTTCTKIKDTAPAYTGDCAGTASNDSTLFGGIVNLSGTTVQATASTIQGSGGGAGVTFPVTRGLYNLYNNSSATDPASQATLNFVSEDGFICKASTGADIDPITGVAYRNEIESVIEAQGFFPLDVTGGTFPEVASGTTLTYPASITDPGYSANDVTNTFVIGGTTYSNTGTTGDGYCLVTNG